MTTGLRVYGTVLTFILGTVFGSFLNCLAWRRVHGESVLKGRSHCAVCGHELSAPDLIPVFSYLFLKGRCRYCGEKISPRYMLAEVLLGCGFAGIFLKYGLSAETLRYLVFTCVLFALSLVDLDSYEIPDSYLIFAVVWWIVTIPLLVWQSRAGGALALIGQSAADGSLSLIGQSTAATPFSLKTELVQGLVGGFAVAGGLLVLSLLFDKITGKESLGGGDIKLLFVTGLYLGIWGNLFNLILSCIVGLLFVVAMRQRRIPFGPGIALSTYLCLLIAKEFVAWYVGLITL